MQYTEAKHDVHFYNRRELEQLKYSNIHVRRKRRGIYTG